MNYLRENTFNKLWLLLDLRGEIDFRLTNCIILCEVVQLKNVEFFIDSGIKLGQAILWLVQMTEKQI